MRVLAALGLLWVASCCLGEDTLLQKGSVWPYYYNGPVATNWNQDGFDDLSWPRGPAPIGYGDGGERTVAFDDGGYEPTLYFRRTFNITNLADVSSATVRLMADDGAIAYLNGTEILRRNMPNGPVDFFTRALHNIETNENVFAQFGLRLENLRPGTNLVAVEVHQHAAGGHDGVFDLEFLINIPIGPPSIVITSPVDGALLPPGDVLIQTAPSDPDGHVTQVSFFANTALLGDMYGESFSFLWVNPVSGRYALTANGFDNRGIRGFSQPVHVQIGDVNDPIALVRGPYLQSGSATSMVIRWRTDWFTDSSVRYGTSASTLDRGFTNATAVTEHEVKISGLQPDTLYFYAVGSSSNTLAMGEQFYFRTSPTNTRPVRIWAIGDSGTADLYSAAVRDSYKAATEGHRADVWLMLGDNAYDAGTDEEYQRAVFETYPELLRNTVLWPAVGNHEAGDSLGGNPEIFQQIFTLPENGAAGGLPSGSELYYSFDYATIHFVCLDSFVSDRATNGPMFTWLRSDLAATEKDWIIVFWHHPPYSWGTHNSDQDLFMTEMRERAVPILEQYGVDLVLSGHSHVYERSFLLNGHYGYSWELQPSMVLDPGLGRADEDGPYHKPAVGLGANNGTVYTVCGCSGEGGLGSFSLYPAMATNHGGFGSMIIDVDGLQLTAHFLRPSLEIDDHFTIDKSAPTTIRPTLNVTRVKSRPVLSWPTSRPDFAVEWAGALPSDDWARLNDPFVTIGRRNLMLISPIETNRFFRLHNLP